MSKKKFIWDDIPNEKEIEKSNYNEIFGEVKKVEVDDVDISYKNVNDIKDKKHSKIKILLFTIIFITTILVLPIFKVDKIKVNDFNFINKDNVINKINIKQDGRYSLLKLFTVGWFFKSDMTSKNEFNYDFKSKTFSINLIENKPLAKGDNGKVYFQKSGGIESVEDSGFTVPTLVGFPNEMEIVDKLSKLKYDIIKEMVIIYNAVETGEKDLLYIEMKDGNYVKIYMTQFEQKMKYYLQIKQIIKSQNKGEKGIINLDKGDYYEKL